MDLSVAIVNWNTAGYLQSCLSSLRAAGYIPAPAACCGRDRPEAAARGTAIGSAALSVEVIVVDNASPDGSAELVRSEFPEVRLIANSENLGYAKGNNQAIQASSGRYILLLNPDTEVPPGALERLVAYLDAHPDTGAVGVRLLNPDGSTQRSCRAFPLPLPLLYEALGLAVLFPKSRRFAAYRMGWFSHNREMEVDQPMGSALALRRQAIQDVGLLDEQFPLFFNEVDWCYRAKQRGWRVAFTPEVSIVHHGGRGTSQIRLAALRESHRSLERFYQKHLRGRIPWPLYVATLAANRVGALVRIAWSRAKGGR